MNHTGQPESREAAQRHLLELQDALDTLRQHRAIRPDSLIWPNGLDRRILNHLPLTVRTQNCLRTAKLMDGSDAMTAKQFLRLPNFGKNSLKDLLHSVEGFLIGCVNLENDGAKLSDIPHKSTAWDSVGKILNPILSATAELHGKTTMADVLCPDVMRLADRMGVSERIKEIDIKEITKDTPRLATLALTQIEKFYDTTSSKQRTIMEHRLLSSPPSTLDHVSTLLGVTRERVRQIQKKIEDQISSVTEVNTYLIASTLTDQFDEIIEQNMLDRKILSLLPLRQNPFEKLFIDALIQKMNLTLKDGVYLNHNALKCLQELKKITNQIVDDVGLVDKHIFFENIPNEKWRPFLPWLLKHFGLLDLYGQLAFRDTAKARIKAALFSIGRPATRQEIESICGVPKDQIGVHLSNVPSVVRADKERWGMNEWIDDQYDGIADEIVQRINEDGGTTSVERVLAELPERFGVKRSSVQMSLSAKKFTVKDGWVELANPTSIKLRDLEDVIHGRDIENRPYWKFLIQLRFFEGYSVQGVPFEVAKALGCDPDKAITVNIENLPNCRPLSINWPLSSATGASLGRVASPLRTLGAKPNQFARVTIKDRGVARLTVDDGTLVGERPITPDLILERIMKRRKAV